MIKLLRISAVILWLFLWVDVSAQSYISVYNAGQEALNKGDVLSFQHNMVKADSIRPNHPVIMYNLAKAFLLNNDTGRSVKTLETLLHFYASPAVLDSSDLEGLAGSDAWEHLNEMLRDYQSRQMGSSVAFEFEKPGFHPEGIAYDERSETFFITDIREGLIYQFNKYDKELKLFKDLEEWGFWSAMGIMIDPTNPDIMWVTTSAMPEFSGYKEEDEGKSAVLKIDKRTGRLIIAYKTDGRRTFGDLTITKKGRIFITDSRNPEVFTIKNNDVLKVAFQHDKWWNLQGLALSDDEKFLYISDYITGIYRVEIQTGEIEPLIEEEERLRGGDGIYQRNGKLIVLQNGSIPRRVAQISLDKKGLGIPQSLTFPDQARLDIIEPTLGSWVGDDLYFIGNSPWGFYKENGEPNLTEWPSLKIFRLTLKETKE